jgi:hypothetical protein
VILQQLQEDLLDFLTNITGFNQRRHAGYGERNGSLESGDETATSCQSLSSDHQNVSFLQLNRLNPVLIQDTLVVVARLARDFLVTVLPDHVSIERRVDIGRFGNYQKHR